MYGLVIGTPSDMSYRTLGLLFVDGVLSWLQNIVAFSVLSIVTPLTYAVANASKRIFVIAVTLFILGNPVTGLNVFGMTMAIVGVLGYNKAKYDQRQHDLISSTLPTTMKNYDMHTQNNGSMLVVNGRSNEKYRLYAV